MPIDSSVYNSSLRTDGTAMRQCQRCFKFQTPETPLKSCSRCKRAHYCSKDCQVADWADHKERCNLNAAATVNIKAESVELKTSGTTVPSSRGNASIDPRQLASDMKQWSQAHRGPLSLVAIHALRLDQDPKNLMKSVLNVFLSPSSRPAPYHLNLEDVVVAPLDEMAEICQNAGHSSDFDQIQKAVEKSRDVQAQGALGFAIIVAYYGRLLQVIPLGIADSPRDAGISYDPEWKQTLKGIVEGRIRI